MDKPKFSGILASLGPLSLALLVTSGQIKGSAALSWLPIDLTLFSLILVIVASMHSRVVDGKASSSVILPILIWVTFLPAVALNSFELTLDAKQVILFGITLPMALAPFYLLRTGHQRQYFLFSLATISLLAVFYGLFIERTLDSVYSDRIRLDGADTIGTARVALAAAIICILFATYRRYGVLVRVLLFSAALLAVFFAVATGSRGPTVAASIAILLTVAAAPAYRKFRVRALLMLAIGVVVLIPIIQASASDGVMRIVEILVGGEDTSTQARERLWSGALHMSAEFPLGAGWGAYADTYGTYPHNFILELAAETGLFVTAIFIFLLASTMIRSRRLAIDLEGATFLALLIFAVLSAMVSSDFNGNRLMIVCLFAVWAVPRIDAKEKDEVMIAK